MDPKGSSKLPPERPKFLQNAGKGEAPRDDRELQMAMASSTSMTDGEHALVGTSTCEKDDQRKQLAPKRSSNKDRHTKVEGRGRRIRMPALCAARIFQLTRELGHKSDGETIQWLLQQSEPSIIAATGSGTIPASALAAAAPSSFSHHSTSVGLHPKFTEPPQSAAVAISRMNWASGLWPPPVSGFPGSGFLAQATNLSVTGEGSAGGCMQRFGLPGFELPGPNLGHMTFASMLSGHGQQAPGLELGLSQDGNIGDLNTHSLSHFYQHMGQVRTGGSGDHLQQQHQNQGSLEKDDSEGSS
ncbi:hypothetical protein HPP92_000347 [Vanilla planifolia]|uniref:TCP domain-containing protein n=1 Tax=Vanilla planifolia TaxID=51239 RepID=A0A835VKD3_VANPL|nr:hypothetical protein HPP92_000347 [Vanilla planifolia]